MIFSFRTFCSQKTECVPFFCSQFVFAAVLAVAAAAPSRSYDAPTYAPKVYQILKQETELRDDLSYDSQ